MLHVSVVCRFHSIVWLPQIQLRSGEQCELPQSVWTDPDRQIRFMHRRNLPGYERYWYPTFWTVRYHDPTFQDIVNENQLL